MATQVKDSMMKSLSTNVLNLMYARFSIRLHSEDRLEVYRKLMALIKNRFSLMDALERLYSIASKDGKTTILPSYTVLLSIKEANKRIGK